MAASDPATDVPTPTGTLQGVAAFSWDGSAWQPTGRAGPAVATPTGVLAGVAPFSWSGSAWTPAGRAQPGVATPSGVLDGVAVYMWSGSAWAPVGGQPTPSTPSGALRGVAAFNWDGAAWQPAGQAGPSVATPYGVLAGAAMFNWTGSAWVAGSVVPAAAMDISLLGPTLDPSITFTRASTATYFDVTGTMQTAASGAPRFDYDPVTHVMRGLLIELAATNLLLNSAALGTQSVAVTAQAYTLSFYGTGTITKSGTAAGALVGTGAFPARVTQTFTPTAGTLTLTVTGTVQNAQLETGSYATSYITTAGATATRTADTASASLVGIVGATASSMAVELMMPFTLGAGTANVSAEIDDGTINNLFNMRYGSGNGSATIVFVAGASTGSGGAAGGFPALTVAKHAASFDSTALNGNTSLNGAAAVSLAFTSAPTGLNRLLIGSGRNLQLNGWMRRVRYWPSVLPAVQLQAATT